jgi:archaemetzincin
VLDPELFHPIPKCKSIDDWLAQYKEEGQTYEQYLNECPWLSSRKWKYVKQRFVKSGTNIRTKYPEGKIYILPLGDFNSERHPDIDNLVKYTSIFLQLPIELLAPANLDVKSNKIVSTVNQPKPIVKELKGRFHNGNYQIEVNSVLQLLKEIIPDDGICLIALTCSDLYETKPDLFVAGMASGNHRVAVFSLFRYDPCLNFSTEYWYSLSEIPCKDSSKRKSIVLQRCCKLLVHEICHLLGVGHCIFYECCMNGSGHLEEDFRQPMMLCPVDLRKLQTLVGFNVIQRYKELCEFCKEHGFSEEYKWYEKRLKSLGDVVNSG